MNQTTPAHGSGTTPAYGSANVHVFKTGRIASRPNRVLSVGEDRFPHTPRPYALRATGANKGFSRQRSFCVLCKMIKGSGGIIPSAARGGPKPGSDGSKRYGPTPKYGRDCADVNPLRTGTRPQTGRNPARLENLLTNPSATLPHQIQTVTKLRIRRADSASALVCGNRR